MVRIAQSTGVCTMTDLVPGLHARIPELNAPVRLVDTGPASGAMRARFGIDAAVGEAKALHRAAGNQMLLDDLRRVFRLHETIPDRFGIHDNRGPVLALVQA